MQVIHKSVLSHVFSRVFDKTTNNWSKKEGRVDRVSIYLIDNKIYCNSSLVSDSTLVSRNIATKINLKNKAEINSIFDYQEGEENTGLFLEIAKYHNIKLILYHRVNCKPLVFDKVSI